MPDLPRGIRRGQLFDPMSGMYAVGPGGVAAVHLARVAGRALGTLAGGVLALLWVYAIWFPSGGLTLAGPSIIVAGLMAVLAIFAAIAASKGHSTVLLLIFIASFLPVGGYLLGVDHWVRWLGALDLLLLLAAALIWWGARTGAPPP